MATNLCEALKNNVLPKPLKHRISEITRGADVENEKSSLFQKELASKSAVYHQKCLVRYNPSVLKRKLASETINKTVPEKPVYAPKVTRPSCNAANFKKSCFFCDETDDDWTVAGPYIADMLSNFGGSGKVKNSKHHENNASFETKFRKHHKLLINYF